MRTDVAIAAGILRLKWLAAAVDFERALRAHHRALKGGFNPDQPRVPAGSPEGGQWTSTGGRVGQGARSADQNVTNADGTPYYARGGHHEMPKDVYEKWNLRSDTRKVFDSSTTGTVPKVLSGTSPDNVTQGHYWDDPQQSHRRYNDGVRELSNRFLEKNNIRPEEMTPDHARALLKEIRESRDPRIRGYNNLMRRIRSLIRLRTGRGLE